MIVLKVVDVRGNPAAPAVGNYVVELGFRPDGRPLVTGSLDIAKARRFPMVIDALAYVRDHGAAVDGWSFEVVAAPAERPPVDTGFTFRQAGVGRA